jgi:hypothetical protein
LPREVVDVLHDDPALLRLAERVAALAEEPSEAAARRRRRLVPAAAAAVMAVVVIGVVGVLLTGGQAPDLSERALAAIGGKPVLYASVAQTVASDRTVELASGRQTAARLTVESWLDEETGRLHILQRRNGGLIGNTLGSVSGVARNASPRLEPALALFLVGYRQALRQGRVRDAGSAVIGGRRIRWLKLVNARPAGERVAVDARSFLPVIFQEQEGTRWTVTRIESLPAAAVDLRPPPSRPPAFSEGGVTAQRASSPSQIAHALGVPALWLGRSFGGLKLTALTLQQLISAFPRSTHRPPQRSAGVSLSYHGPTGTSIELREATTPLPAYSFSGGRTFGFDPIPPQGSMQLTSIGSGWIGQLQRGRLYITITGPDQATVIQAARNLDPIHR